MTGALSFISQTAVITHSTRQPKLLLSSRCYSCDSLYVSQEGSNQHFSSSSTSSLVLDQDKWINGQSYLES